MGWPSCLRICIYADKLFHGKTMVSVLLVRVSDSFRMLRTFTQLKTYFYKQLRIRLNTTTTLKLVDTGICVGVRPVCYTFPSMYKKKKIKLCPPSIKAHVYTVHTQLSGYIVYKFGYVI